MKETIQQANYYYCDMLCKGKHLLRNLDTGKIEIFVTNKNHAGWGLIFKNTHLEFCKTLG